jgi:hypothetical protein
MYDQSAVIENVKVLTGEDNTALITLLVKKAEETAKTFCNVADIQEEMTDVIEDIACLKYNLRGREGIVSESMGKNSVTMNAELPADIKMKLSKFRIIRMW